MPSVGREPGIFWGLAFGPAVLPHVMFADLFSAKVKQFCPTFDDLLAGLRVGVAAFPGPGDAVAMVAAIIFVDFEKLEISKIGTALLNGLY